MNYGLYLSASGTLVAMHRQDVAANNLANVGTVGFKRSLDVARQRDAEAIEDRLGADVSHRLLDRLGGGVFAGKSEVSREEGALDLTSNPLDLAVRGEGFFVVGGLPGAKGAAGEAALTRDGRFTMASDGRLVMTANGRAVLDTTGKSIALDPAQPVHVDTAGRVTQGGTVVGQLQLIEPAAGELRHIGDGLYALGSEDVAGAERASGQVRQGFVEQSNVNGIAELTALIGATKEATTNANMIRYHDMVMDRAVNVLGRVS